MDLYRVYDWVLQGWAGFRAVGFRFTRRVRGTSYLLHE